MQRDDGGVEPWDVAEVDGFVLERALEARGGEHVGDLAVPACGALLRALHCLVQLPNRVLVLVRIESFRRLHVDADAGLGVSVLKGLLDVEMGEVEPAAGARPRWRLK
jgi:hypothetical protein